MTAALLRKQTLRCTDNDCRCAYPLKQTTACDISSIHLMLGERMAKKTQAPKAGDANALVWQVYDGLCEEIASGQLRPGELLSRRRIAQRYGVSYTPVIEALVRLEQ